MTGGRRLASVGQGLIAALCLLASAATAATPSTATLFVFDTSGSLRTTDLENAKQLARARVGRLAPGEQVGIIAFDDSVNLLAPFSDSPETIEQALGKLRIGGRYSVLHDAIWDGSQELARSGALARVMVLLTDGHDEHSALLFEDAERGAVGARVQVVAIGVGRQIDEGFMRRFVKLTAGLYFPAGAMVDPDSILDAMSATSASFPSAAAGAVAAATVGETTIAPAASAQPPGAAATPPGRFAAESVAPSVTPPAELPPTPADLGASAAASRTVPRETAAERRAEAIGKQAEPGAAASAESADLWSRIPGAVRPLVGAAVLVASLLLLLLIGRGIRGRPTPLAPGRRSPAPAGVGTESAAGNSGSRGPQIDYANNFNSEETLGSVARQSFEESTWGHSRAAADAAAAATAERTPQAVTPVASAVLDRSAPGASDAFTAWPAASSRVTAGLSGGGSPPVLLDEEATRPLATDSPAAAARRVVDDLPPLDPRAVTVNVPLSEITAGLNLDGPELLDATFMMVEQPMLFVRKGDREGETFPLAAAGDTVIGRSKSNPISLKDRSVSARHARIRTEGKVITVLDLGSTNGSFLNNRRLEEETFLEVGDVIRVGDTEFVLQVKQSSR